MTENKKYEKGTLGWLREQQKIKAKKDGFDNVDDWLKWKTDPFNILERKYGKEFTDWTRQNRSKTPDKWLNTGCKTQTEYQNRCAQKRGLKDDAERKREWRHETGRNLPKEFNEHCSSWFSYIGENYISKTFEDPVRMPYGNPGFDWKCKKGEKIDHKGACLTYPPIGSPGWEFDIEYNNITDYFILSAWDSRDSLTPLHIWVFHKNDIVRGRKFWRRCGLRIANTPKCLKEFEKYEVIDRLDKLKELCKRKKK